MAIKTLLFIFLPLLTSCGVTGILYADVKTPYCTNMRDTIVTDAPKGERKLKQVSIPRVPGARAYWNSNSIVEAARDAGLEKIHFCDLHTFSVLNGLWLTENVIVYGE